MLRLIPKPAADSRPDQSPSPTALVYTMLRHGRALGHSEAARLLRLSARRGLAAPTGDSDGDFNGDFDGPFQAA